MYLSVSRVTSQVDLCCTFRAVTLFLRICRSFIIPLLFFLHSTECWVTSNQIEFSRTKRQETQRREPRLVRCRILSGETSRLHRSYVHAPHAASCDAHERSLTISVRVKYVTRHRRKLRTSSRNCRS